MGAKATTSTGGSPSQRWPAAARSRHFPVSTGCWCESAWSRSRSRPTSGQDNAALPASRRASVRPRATRQLARHARGVDSADVDLTSWPAGRQVAADRRSLAGRKSEQARSVDRQGRGGQLLEVGDRPRRLAGRGRPVADARACGARVAPAPASAGRRLPGPGRRGRVDPARRLSPRLRDGRVAQALDRAAQAVIQRHLSAPSPAPARALAMSGWRTLGSSTGRPSKTISEPAPVSAITARPAPAASSRSGCRCSPACVAAHGQPDRPSIRSST